jgi:hypothetical protein
VNVLDGYFRIHIQVHDLRLLKYQLFINLEILKLSLSINTEAFKNQRKINCRS